MRDWSAIGQGAGQGAGWGAVGWGAGGEDWGGLWVGNWGAVGCQELSEGRIRVLWFRGVGVMEVTARGGLGCHGVRMWGAMGWAAGWNEDWRALG